MVTDDDKEMFSSTMQRFARVNREHFGPLLRQDYWEILKILDRPAFERAAKYLLEHSKWFPKPAEFIQVSRTVGWI